MKDGKVVVSWKSGDKTGEEVADKVLVATGRKPVTDGLGLKEIGVATRRQRVRQNRRPLCHQRPRHLGDRRCHRRPDARPQSRGRRHCRRRDHGRQSRPRELPHHPRRRLHASRAAQVGLTEADAKREGREVRIGKFPFSANGRAKSIDETDGVVKIIGDAKTDRLLGVQILGAHASDMIAECVMAMEMAASVEDLARTNHAHPTLPEAVKEAAMAVEKRAIHVVKRIGISFAWGLHRIARPERLDLPSPARVSTFISAFVYEKFTSYTDRPAVVLPVVHCNC